MARLRSVTAASPSFIYQNSQTLTHAACAATGTSIAKTYGGPIAPSSSADGAADESVSPQSGISQAPEQEVRLHRVMTVRDSITRTRATFATIPSWHAALYDPGELDHR
jgi:hypothetical protein